VDAGCEHSFLVRFAVSFSFVLWVLDCGLARRRVTLWWFCVGTGDYVVVIALPRNAYVAMNWGLAGVV